MSAIAAAIFLTGCGNNSNHSTSSTQSTNSSPANATVGNSTPGPGDYLGALGQAQQYSVKKIDTASLTEAIQQFNAAEGRYPKDLQELVPTYLAKIPDAPTGSKLNYDPANGTVAVVKQ